MRVTVDLMWFGSQRLAHVTVLAASF